MTESEIRNEYVSTANAYLGAKQGGAKHREIVTIYNSYLPHPRGYVLTETDAWCAAFVSACAIQTGLTDIIPVECSCGEQVKAWQRMGRWEEHDDYVPAPGDLLYYHWRDDGEGDCTGAPQHVGIVVNVVGDDVLVIEGNKGDSHVVGYRHVAVDGVTIRGFGLPDFAAAADKTGRCEVELPVLQYGAVEEAVKSMQTLLNFRTRAKLDVDGSFGPATRKAVKAFQEKVEIAVDGSCGPITWGRLING